MQLYIRTQKRNKLVPITHIIDVYNCDIFHKETILGTYDTKERAMKVLDLIQDHLNNQGSVVVTKDHVTLKEYGNVFIMPKE